MLLRSDGLVDRSKGYSVVDKTFRSANGAPYISINTQFVGQGGENDDGANIANYMFRADGVIDRFVYSRDVEKQIVPPLSAKYVSGSTMQTASYFVRDDGVVDRTKGHAKIHNTMHPPEGVKYVMVSAGRQATYLLRSDGRVDRTTGYGKVHQTLEVSGLR